MTDFRPLVSRLERSARRFPAATAIVHDGIRTTYAQLWSQILGVAGFLRANGLKSGDRVVIVQENSASYVVSYYGALAAGGVAVALNPSARVRELQCWIDHCASSWLIADVRLPDFQRLAGLPGIAARLIGVGGTNRGAIPWEQAVAAAPAVPERATVDTVAAILYTSGTTGSPKGVMLSHGNLSANASSIIEYLALNESDRVLNVLPFFYSYGSSVLHTHLAVGGTLVLENSLVYPQRVLRRMAEERVTGLPGVPSTFTLLLHGADPRVADLPSLRYVTQAGGPMTPSHINRVRELLPNVRFFVMYGQTEATARLTYLPPERLADKLGSVGTPVPGVRLEVRTDDGRPAQAGEPGEVWVSGPNVMLGYYGDPAGTSAVLRDGWLRTMDLGYVDGDGYLYLQGRRSDIIKSGAHRISPLDIEEVISAIPQVAEVAVVGVPDTVLGEAVKAVVTLRAGATLDGLSIQRHCSQHLPRYKVPKTVEFVARLPRTASGKIMRYRLGGTSTDDDHNARTA